MAKWTKTTPYGDYRDPLQNHKFDNWLILNPNTGKHEVYNKLRNILHEASWYYGKHIASKKLSNIKAINKKANNKRSLFKSVINNIEKNAETSEQTGN